MQTKYQMRRAEMTREQSAMVRKMLDSQLAAYKNWIASAVECGTAEYGNSNKSGNMYAKELVKELREHEALCQIFPPDDMWVD